jgi:hypothetical protein
VWGPRRFEVGGKGPCPGIAPSPKVIDVACATGAGWTALIKSLFRIDAWAAGKALIEAFKTAGPARKPSKSDRIVA